MAKHNNLKAISELENFHFFVPSYQRGYRWVAQKEIKQLLKDIWDFAQFEQKDGSLYCLQPIVVKNNSNEFIVIDGQQRLTTIFLIIKFLHRDCIFDISYETRENSKDFLQNIESKSKNEATNIDFWHFYEAYQKIVEFFNDKSIDKDRFLATLLNDCKVLWYEIANSESESAVFRRLNIGKIPLQEAENIKALFLSKNEFLDSDDIKDRAQVWYEAEIKLREERDFAYCVLANINENNIMRTHKPYALSDDISRIEVYLKAISSPQKENKLFEFFDDIYREKTLDSKWEELESCIDNFCGFASKGVNQIDRKIFHYIGFLSQSGEKISKIYSWWKVSKSKEKFVEILFEKICERMQEIITKIDDLDYRQGRDDRHKIHALLLLANLQYLINDESSNKYFEFNRFALEQWSLEHIYAQNSQSLKEAIKVKDKNALKEWLDESKKYIENKELQREIDKFLEQIQVDKSSALLNKIDEDFKNSDSLHSVGNISLLDRDSNAKLGNLIFSKKRKEIEQLGKEDKLIPILTEKVFNKSIKI